MDDGVSLISAAHPRSAWYRRLWLWLFPPRISPDSLETIEINIMSDNEIEQEIQAKGLTAPRVTLAHVEGCIAWELYFTGREMYNYSTAVMGPAYKAVANSYEVLQCLTLCVLTLKNGFVVTGEYACASPENFDAALGRKIARQKALDKVWMLEGYLLKDSLHEAAPT